MTGKPLGKVILFEGMDGSGKSTLVKGVAEVLTGQGYEVRVQAFPSREGPIGQFIREQIFTANVEVDEQAMMPLMLADAVDFNAVIAGWRASYDFILLDRHTLVSAWAYQLSSWPLSLIADMTSPGVFGDALPDMVLLLDVEPEVAMGRLAERSGPKNHLYEKDEAYAEELRSRYLAWYMLNKGLAPVAMLDGEMPPHQLLEAATSLVVPN